MELHKVRNMLVGVCWVELLHKTFQMLLFETPPLPL